jgi:hypothetical protein
MDGGELKQLYDRTREATNALHAKARDPPRRRPPERTKGPAAWYAATRARVEARATLEQAEELGRVLEEVGGRLGE